MAQNCIIVESPSKAKTIKKYLGDNFNILATVGHIRDLPKKELGIDTANNFEPKYIALQGKNDVIMNLKKAVKAAENVYIATDPDREGEAIAWHLTKLLKLDETRIKRIAFHEITRNAVQEAVQHPQKINLELVNAQQARRVLDRLVGFELSPLLWRKIKPSLSAGRVQSVAVRLIVEREEEIEAFETQASFKVTAIFTLSDGTEINAELSKRYKREEDVEKILQSCIAANFHISGIEKKKAQKNAPAPFTTSTLQQEAGRKLRFSVSQTMMLAQKLYEAGNITYMRTDSLNLSNMSLSMVKEQVVEMFGDAYSHTRKFKTKAKGAQEAHEAIRPTNMKVLEAGDNKNLKSLYKLIWRRTMASQMTAAEIERTTVQIANDKNAEILEAKGEVITFPGFMAVYKNGDDESKLLPPMKEGETITLQEMDATEKFSQPPSRYSEPMLVKKMEELGIGRPSTYAPTISTIQKRGYVEKGNKPGVERDYLQFSLIDGEIKREIKKEKANVVKSKLFPTDIGRVVNKFLVNYFDDIINYNFTAHIEQDFDKIADGKMEWHAMIKEFYVPFHAKIEETRDKSETFKGERLLGVDPESGNNVYVKIGRFGPMVQLGESKSEEKPRFASLQDDQRLDSIDLNSALSLLSFPKTIGHYEEDPMVVAFGRFGPYVKHKNKFYALAKDDTPAEVGPKRAIELIEEGREKARKRVIKDFTKEKIQVLNGRYGPYIVFGGKNFKIPKGSKPESLTPELCHEIIEKSKKAKGKDKK
ncbi:MAG: type I DNA topoisomerase [Candidatus Marinimicrobia bacterium]|nr:type I DNA topoisomerase [Candidatus Neomarinimicrobiota bacterium]